MVAKTKMVPELAEALKTGITPVTATALGNQSHDQIVAEKARRFLDAYEELRSEILFVASEHKDELIAAGVPVNRVNDAAIYL